MSTQTGHRHGHPLGLAGQGAEGEPRVGVPLRGGGTTGPVQPVCLRPPRGLRPQETLQPRGRDGGLLWPVYYTLYLYGVGNKSCLCTIELKGKDSTLTCLCESFHEITA